MYEENPALMPDFLLDIDKTLLASRQQRLEKCYNLKNLLESQIAEINKMNNQYSGMEKKEKEKQDDLYKDIVQLKESLTNKKRYEEKLMNQISETKKVIDNEEYKKPNCDELTILFKKIEILKNDLNCKKSKIVQDLDKFKMGISYYRNYLQCHVFYVPEDQIVITFDKFAKTVSEARECIKFKICDGANATKFKFVEMQPKLKSQQKMVDRFNETGDIQGFVLHIQKSFKSLKLIN